MSHPKTPVATVAREQRFMSSLLDRITALENRIAKLRAVLQRIQDEVDGPDEVKDALLADDYATGERK